MENKNTNHKDDSKQQNQVDIEDLKAELQRLKVAHTDLINKYNELQNSYDTYKFDIEFKENTKDIKMDIPDKDMDILKGLKMSNNNDAYKLLLDRYMVQSHAYLNVDKDGRLSPTGYSPQDESSATEVSNVDLFTGAIDEIKGGN